METITKPKQSLVGIEMVRRLAQRGDRVFSTDRARQVAPDAGLKAPYLHEALHHLARNGWIVPLRRGSYALSSAVPASPRPRVRGRQGPREPRSHLALVALHHHGMTEQAPRTSSCSRRPRAPFPARAGRGRGRGRLPGGGYGLPVHPGAPHRFFRQEQAGWARPACQSRTGAHPARRPLHAAALRRLPECSMPRRGVTGWT